MNEIPSFEEALEQFRTFLRASVDTLIKFFGCFAKMCGKGLLRKFCLGIRQSQRMRILPGRFLVKDALVV